MSRLLAAIRRRPVRVVESLLVLLGAFGVVLAPDQSAAILALLALLVGASEAAQTATTPLADPHDSDGRPLAPVNGVPDERGAD